MVGQPGSDPHSAATGHLQPVLLPPSPSDFFSVQIPLLTSTAIKPSRTCDPQSTSADTSDPTPTRIVETIGNWFGEGSSCSGDPLVRCRLRPADLLTFQDLIREHPRWSDKIRYDYFPETETFILRMPPSITHETAASGFYELVKEKLAQLCSEDPASKDWDRELRSDRQTSIDKQLSTTTQETHSPDDQIRHSRAKFPAIILEVANAQRAEDLPELAKYYIEAGEGNTKLVVGVDFDYTTRGSKAIRMITWRLNVEYNSDRTAIGWSIKRQTQAFRTSNGEAVPHAKLRISIKDFAPESLIPKCLVEKFIEISAEQYCQYLDGANARGDEEGISEPNLDLNLRRLSSSSSTLDSSGESSGDGGSEPNNKHDGD